MLFYFDNCSYFFSSCLGLNLARMLGDKFLKQQDSRFSSEPYISEVVHIQHASSAFAIIARYFGFKVLHLRVNLYSEMSEILLANVVFLSIPFTISFLFGTC